MWDTEKPVDKLPQNEQIHDMNQCSEADGERLMIDAWRQMCGDLLIYPSISIDMEWGAIAYFTKGMARKQHPSSYCSSKQCPEYNPMAGFKQ